MMRHFGKRFGDDRFASTFLYGHTRIHDVSTLSAKRNPSNSTAIPYQLERRLGNSVSWMAAPSALCMIFL
jgi:hypothetical protein